MKIRVTTDEVRRTLRTALAVLVAVAAAVPLLVEAGVLTPDRAPWLASIVAFAALVTRLMQNPSVDALLGKLLGAPFTIDGVPAAAKADAPAVEPVEPSVPALDGPGDGSDLGQ